MSTLEEYRKVDAETLTSNEGYVVKRLADAALAELEAENERMADALSNDAEHMALLTQRAEQAEAMRDKAIDELRKGEERFAELEAALAERERMLDELKRIIGKQEQELVEADLKARAEKWSE